MTTEDALNHLVKRLSMVVALGASLLLPMTDSALGQLDSKNPFKVGAVLSKSGPYSQFGGYGESALLVAVKQVNEAGGILGRKVELVIRDDASNPGRALLATKELVEEQKVD